MTELKCTKCGTINVGDAGNCRICGHPLHHSQQELRACPHCGSMATPTGEERCISCGWNLGASPRTSSAALAPSECETSAEGDLHTVRSFTVDLAAVFMVISGALGVFHSLMAALPGTTNEVLATYGDVIPAGAFLNDVLQQYVFVSILMFVFGATCIGLSVTAVNRSNFAVSVAGAILGILSIGFLFGAFFGLMALILILVSKREYLLECPA